MGDGAEIVNMSDGKEKKLSEDRISDEQVERNELVGSDEAWDNEEEVFEEAIGSLEAPKTESFEAVGSHEGLPLEATPENSKDEHDEVVDVLEEERGVKGSKVNYSVVGESHGEVNVQLVTSGEAEPDLVTPKINDDKGEAGQEIPHGQIESSLDVVENSEKATSNGSNLAAEDVNMQNGNTHSFQENGMVSPENKELVAEVISISVRSEETRNDGIEDGNWEEKADVSAGMEREEEVGEGEGTNMNFSKKGFVCIDNESGAQRNGETGAGYNSVKMASGDKSLNDSVEVLNDGTSSPLEKSSPEEKGETEGHSSSSFPGVTFREHETVQNGNKRHDVQHSPQRNKELEKQQGSIVNIGPEIT